MLDPVKYLPLSHVKQLVINPAEHVKQVESQSYFIFYFKHFNLKNSNVIIKIN